MTAMEQMEESLKRIQQFQKVEQSIPTEVAELKAQVEKLKKLTYAIFGVLSDEQKQLVMGKGIELPKDQGGF